MMSGLMFKISADSSEFKEEMKSAKREAHDLHKSLRAFEAGGLKGIAKGGLIVGGLGIIFKGIEKVFEDIKEIAENKNEFVTREDVHNAREIESSFSSIKKNIAGWMSLVAAGAMKFILPEKDPNRLFTRRGENMKRSRLTGALQEEDPFGDDEKYNYLLGLKFRRDRFIGGLLELYQAPGSSESRNSEMTARMEEAKERRKIRDEQKKRRDEGIKKSQEAFDEEFEGWIDAAKKRNTITKSIREKGLSSGDLSAIGGFGAFSDVNVRIWERQLEELTKIRQAVTTPRQTIGDGADYP